MTEFEKLTKAAETVQKRSALSPLIGIVLGSGLGGFADSVKAECIINYSDIPHFPLSTVSGHAGRLILGHLADMPVAVMQGRVHYYEGYSMHETVMPVRLLGLLGIRTLFLTNAAGGVNPMYRPGDFMLIRDHISFLAPSPLIGENIDSFGVRFPDMSEIYPEKQRTVIRNTASDLGITLHEGVYMQFTGPAYETPAEIHAAAVLGADAVGMSTACEATAARHMGIPVCGISCISNMAAGITSGILSHEEVKTTAGRIAPDFCSLLKESVVRTGKELL